MTKSQYATIPIELLEIESNMYKKESSISSWLSYFYSEIDVLSSYCKYETDYTQMLDSFKELKNMKDEIGNIHFSGTVGYKYGGLLIIVYGDNIEGFDQTTREWYIEAVKNPSNFLVRIGTPISQLIEIAGGTPENTGKIIGGGPMMGKALVSADVPVCKGTSGILLLTKEESVRKPMHDCIRCAKCVNVCPMGLNPAFLMKYTVYQKWDLAEKEHIHDCIECGSCSYTCPANRPLLDYIRSGKGKVMNIIRNRKS